MRRAILILTLLALVPSPGQTNACDSCSPVYGYYRACQSRCDSAPMGSICQFDSKLPREAYCLQLIVQEPPVYACHDGSFDCCCARVPPPL